MKSSLQGFTGLLLSVLLSGVPTLWAQSSQAQAPAPAADARQDVAGAPVQAKQSAPQPQAADLPDSPGYSQTQARAQETTVAQTEQPQPTEPQAQPTEPQAQPPQTQPGQPTQSQSPSSSATAPDQNPAGAAAAQRGKTAGGAASRPAGAALAPAKQRNPRSLFIKLGLLAGAGAALGTAFALSQASPSRPPGAR
jgi:cytoskeletal protein RodZ